MGSCTLCNKKEQLPLEDDLHIEELSNSFPLGRIPSNLSKDITTANDVRNYLTTFEIFRNKLATDKGNVRKLKQFDNTPNTGRELVKANTFREDPHLKSIEENKRNKPQARRSLETSKQLPVSFKRFGTSNLTLQRELRIDISEKKVPLITFDPSNLILETKGKITDRYKIIKMLGKGTFGEVHKIMHVRSKKMFAMKIINKGAYENTENITNEIAILKSLVSCLVNLGSS